MFFDVSTSECYDGAVLEILRLRFDWDMFPVPMDIDGDRRYRNLKRREKVLLQAIGNGDSEALEGLRSELEMTQDSIQRRESRHQRDTEGYENIKRTIEEEDAEAAKEILNYYMDPDDEYIEMLDIVTFNAKKEVAHAEA